MKEKQEKENEVKEERIRRLLGWGLVAAAAAAARSKEPRCFNLFPVIVPQLKTQ